MIARPDASMITRRAAVLGSALALSAATAALLVPRHRLQAVAQALLDPVPQKPAGSGQKLADAEPWAHKLIRAAESQIGVTLRYDPAYTRIAYPGGDVPREKGVCTDVIIRAYRDGLGIDLQERVHRDMLANFAAYPRKWGLTKPDANIDHRRVPNLRVFFARHGQALLVTARAGDYRPGDIVTQRLPGNLDHIILVTDRSASPQSAALAVHNIGAGARLEDVLFAYDITGHYRFAEA